MDLTHWKGIKWQSPKLIQGRLARLERLDVTRHAAVLYQAYSAKGQDWTYLPYGPFASSPAFQRWIADQADLEEPCFYAIRDQEQGAWCGMASYLRNDGANGSIEIGHLNFAPILQRRPAATEAIYLLLAEAFAAGYRRVEWKCDTRNMASRRAAQRFGFSYEGTFRQHRVVKGRNRDTAWFAVCDGEWPALQAAYDAWLNPINFDDRGHQRERLSDLTRLIRVSDDPDFNPGI